MRIALVGYGKMGKEIERLAIERKWDVTVRVDIDTPPVTTDQYESTDAVIHFANAKTIVNDLTPWIKAFKPIVVGTTGWSEQLSQVEGLIRKYETGLIH